VVSRGVIPTLRTIANVVTTYGKTTTAVIGHPDATGATPERKALANQRAEAIRNMLLGMNVPPILNASFAPNSMLGVDVDITETKQAEMERQRLQAQLLQAQKMEAIGTLAGSLCCRF
jgi:mannose/fructose-specific phosphotransferase system component IIA